MRYIFPCTNWNSQALRIICRVREAGPFSKIERKSRTGVAVCACRAALAASRSAETLLTNDFSEPDDKRHDDVRTIPPHWPYSQ